MRSLAAERRAFGLIGQRAGADEIAFFFEEAAAEAEFAHKTRPYEGDTHPKYLEFWAASMRCRAAERIGDTRIARANWEAANLLQSEFTEPSKLFQRAGLWSSTGDFQRESLVLDAMTALESGESGLTTAADLVNTWAVALESDPTVSDTRRTQGRIRALALEALAQLADGGQSHTAINEANGLVEVAALIDRSGLALLGLARKAKRASDLTALSQHAIRLIAPDNSRPVRPVDLFQYLPPWYRELHAKSAPPSACSPLLTRWYLRVVTDYLYSVYADRFGELPGPTKAPPAPDLALADLPFLLTVLQALMRALGWKGAQNQALEELVLFAEAAQMVTDDDERLGRLFATMRRTQRLLYPTPASAPEALSPPGDVRIRAYIGQEHEKLIHPPYDEIPVHGFFYLKPKEKQRTTLQRRDGRPLHVYEARAFGVPKRTTLLCEGPTDQMALQVILDAIDPTWRLLDLAVEPAGGAAALALRAASLITRGEAVVAIIDGDQAGQSSGPWGQLWDHCHTAIIEPDLERSSYEALACALTSLCGRTVSVVELHRLDARTRSTSTDFGATLRAYFKIGGGLKGADFGRNLGQAFLEVEVPNALRDTATTALSLANGIAAPCINKKHKVANR